MSDAAVIAALPEHLRVLRRTLDTHARPAAGGGVTLLLLHAYLLSAEMLAEQLASLTPDAPRRAQQEQQRFHAPLGDRSPVVEEPLVSRRGHDPRLPGKRPHP